MCMSQGIKFVRDSAYSESDLAIQSTSLNDEPPVWVKCWSPPSPGIQTQIQGHAENLDIHPLVEQQTSHEHRSSINTQNHSVIQATDTVFDFKTRETINRRLNNISLLSPKPAQDICECTRRIDTLLQKVRENSDDISRLRQEIKEVEKKSGERKRKPNEILRDGKRRAVDVMVKGTTMLALGAARALFGFIALFGDGGKK
ncbi:hypothetical protein HK096_000193, partial [Nowakowskiella sp. JEL0078]